MLIVNQSEMMRKSLQAYRDMEKRFAQKMWKSGKRAATVRIPAREIPFTLEEFRDWICKDVGIVRPCSHDIDEWHCNELLSVSHYVVDHVMPVSRGGHIGLNNLQLICADCNNVKGDLNWTEYLELRKWLTTCSPHIEKSVLHRLRAVGSALQLRRLAWGQKRKPAPLPPTDENW